MLSSAVCSFMVAQGYAIVTWVYPNVVFERTDDVSAPGTRRVNGWETAKDDPERERVA